MALVYALASAKEPDTIRYIGRTKSNSPNKRLSVHKRSASSGGIYHVHNWIRKVEESDDHVIAITLEAELTWEESGKREIHWISHYRNLGFDLTNMTSGGDGAPDLSEESRLIMSNKKLGKGHPQTEETRQKIREARLGLKPSDEVREKYRQAKLGRSMSEETKAKISKSMAGKKKSEDTKKKMSEWQIGRVLSEEHKEAVSSALKEYYSKESNILPGGRRRNNE